MNETTLEARLTALRDEIAWPPTPDLAPAVRARIAEAPVTRPRWRRPLPRLATIAATVLAVLVAAAAIALAASPAVRARVKDWLGIGAVRIERVQRLPNVAPARTLALGRRVAGTGVASRAVHFPVARIGALGAPDAVYVDPRIPGGAASLVYLARPGLPPSTAGVGALLGEFRGDGLVFIKKIAATGTRVDEVMVNGLPGYWIAGPHVVLFQDRNGEVEEQRARLAGNTLVWAVDLSHGIRLTYRLETGLGEAQALRLARSVR